MDLNSIRTALRAEPFRPFVLCLADGRRVPVKHPEFVAMNQRIVIVIADDGSWAVVEPILVVSLDDAAAKGKGGKRDSKRRRGE